MLRTVSSAYNIVLARTDFAFFFGIRYSYACGTFFIAERDSDIHLLLLPGLPVPHLLGVLEKSKKPHQRGNQVAFRVLRRIS